MSKTYSAGIVTAYGAAKRAGYQGTYEDFCRQQAGYAESVAAVEAAKTAAQTAANTATTKASEASASATAAQTAKTQTEAAASQALTDISTAESGAISAVQTEGATQTANARAQAQAAAQSANTASTKASEASAFATTATTKATEAAASATSAANAASAAQGVLESIPEDYSDLSEDVVQLKADLGDKFPVSPVLTRFFDNCNYGAPENTVFFSGKYASTEGVVLESVNTNSLMFRVEPNTTYYLQIPGNNRQIVVESNTGDFVVGSTYTRLTVSRLIYNNLLLSFTTGSNAKFVLVYFYSGVYDYDSNKDNIVMTKDRFNPDIIPTIKKEYLPKHDIFVSPGKTTFFEDANYFDPNNATEVKGYVSQNGVFVLSGSVCSVMFPVEPNTTYWFFAPGMNRAFSVENDSDVFKLDETYTLLTAASKTTPTSFTTGNTARYVLFYFYNGTYDYESNKNSIILNKDVYAGANAIPYIPYKHLPKDLSSPLSNANILIFGDSITTTCEITVNENDETTGYTWINPSNSYVNGQGETVTFSMWAKILKESEPCGEIRNYAQSGASYKTSERTAGNERQNLHYQIDIALNDRKNPNDVFEVDDFVPDIVIFALGTNDGTPNDTFADAMSKTVLQSDGYSIDVDATISALNEGKFCESARKAFMRVKQAFPMAQIFCVLPIQRANNDVNFDALHDVLKKIAERYGCIIIDGATASGITRDFNVKDALGIHLKDGLHPNEKGQNLMARMIISSLKRNFIPFGTGFNATN